MARMTRAVTRNVPGALAAGAFAVLISLGTPTPVFAAPRHQDWTPGERWAWSRIVKGETADFDRRCGNANSKQPNGQGGIACRVISSSFLTILLTSKPWQDEIPFEGVQLTGARMVGPLLLANTHLTRPLVISDSAFDAAINLSQAATDSVLVLRNSIVEGDLDADFLRAAKNVDLSRTVFRSGASFTGATIAGQLELIGARFGGPLRADHIQVGDSLWMGRSSNRQRRGPLTIFHEVDLDSAKIGASLYLGGSRVLRGFSADSLQVGDVVGGGASFQDVNFGAAKVAQNLYLPGSTFRGPVSAIYLRVYGNVDLSEATLTDLDLGGAWIGGELRLARDGHPARWLPRPGMHGDLSLRNAHVAELVDAEAAWPDAGHLHLDGFTFDQFGGAEESDEEAGQDMRSRPPSWWAGWAQRDLAYSPGPYIQLAKVFTAAGDRSAADQIRYAGWVQERKTQKWPLWLWTGVLQYLVGFGIGNYAFRVLYPVVLISLALGVYLWTRVPAVRVHGFGFWWCVCAGFDRLFPVLQINKSFKDFFDQAHENHLTPTEDFVFSSMRIVGLALGGILAAAVGGLTHGP
jgi:uncharacterized protein YjbI with pentapeptide repeats